MTAVLIAVAALVLAIVVLGIRSRSALSKIENSHDREGMAVELEDGGINVVDLGADNPGTSPIVLIHGAGSNLQDLRMALGDRLARDTRVIMIDRPGHGWSDSFDRSDIHTPEGQAIVLNEVLSRLDVQQPILVGHSWGAALALTYALSYPEEVGGIVAIAPASHPWPGGVSWIYRLGATPVLGWLTSVFLVPILGPLFVGRSLHRVFSPQDVPEGYAQGAGVSLTLRPRAFRDNACDMVSLQDYLSEQARYYGEITVPVVVITGDEDEVVSPKVHAETLASDIEQARLLVLNEVGHMPHHASPNVIAFEIARMSQNS